MALNRNAPAPVKKPKQQRSLVTNEEHVVEVNLTRRDQTGNLFTAIVDLGRGTAQIKQLTIPTTLDLDGVGDILEYFNEVYNLLDTAPPLVTATGVSVPARVKSTTVAAPKNKK